MILPRRVSPDSLKCFAQDLLKAGGLSEKDAGTVAEVLVFADLRGVPSHGVSRIPRYLEMLSDGDMNATPSMRYVRDNGVISILDADRGPGPVAMTMATSDAAYKARAAGCHITLVRATTHTAALGYYTRKIAEAGALALAFAASGPTMAYHGSKQAGVSTSPLSIAAPGADGRPIVFDMGTGAISLGKLAQLMREGSRIPDGAAIDDQGKPVIGSARNAIPMAVGGAKGSGLSLMIEFLASILASNPILAGALGDAVERKRHRQNAIVMVLDIASFCDPAYFLSEARKLTVAIKALSPAMDGAEILLPGERGDRAQEQQLSKGISLSARTVQDLEMVAARFNVTVDRQWVAAPA